MYCSSSNGRYDGIAEDKTLCTLSTMKGTGKEGREVRKGKAWDGDQFTGQGSLVCFCIYVLSQVNGRGKQCSALRREMDSDIGRRMDGGMEVISRIKE